MKKKIISAILALTVLSAVVTVPVSVKGEKIRSWKFDFGAEGSKPQSGYTLVTPDMHIINSENREYGFIGTNEKDYRLHGGRIDGFIQQEGQVIDLVAGDGGIGSIGIKDKTITGFNSGDYYPVRFALKVPDETYYKVRATVTTLDLSKEATASLYTERKHPIFTERVIAPGEEVTSEFTVRVTPVYYEKSDPKGLVEDKYVSVCLLGENAALASLEIEQIESAPTLWILGDSTVTDGGGSLPFFPLQNYTGVGTGVTKYLPENIAMVNEGEGGLSAHDNSHFNVVKDRIKEGDFLWVEYGHNHKSDGVAGYESAIGKYYDVCKKVGATLILVGPIDRINGYDAATNTWHSSLSGFSDAAKKFVDNKLKENPDDKIAFVDLNEPSLKWFGEITKSGVVNNETVTNEKRLVYFYFQANRGATDVDHTHPNDSGAENLAYLFFENADCETYPALSPLLTRFNEGRSEKPTLVSDDIINMGFPANNAWPYFTSSVKHEYPLEIIDVEINEDNEILSIKSRLLDKEQLTSYAAGFVEVGEKTYQTTIESHIDNSAANNGSIYTVEFAKDNLPIVGEEPYRVYMAGVDMADNDKPIENSRPFSADYAPSEYSAYILASPDSDIEKFDYYGNDTLTGSGDWYYGGGLERDSLGEEEDGRSFVHIKGEGFSLDRPLQQLDDGTGTSGRYMFSMDVKKGEADGKTQFYLANGWRNSVPYIQGDTVILFEVENDSVTLNGNVIGKIQPDAWTTVSCVIDMDEGVLTVNVNGNEGSALLEDYRTFDNPKQQGMYHFVIGSDTKADIKLSELFGAKCNLYDRTKAKVDVYTEGAEYGGVLIDDNAAVNKEVNAGDWVQLKAAIDENGRFMGWFCNGEAYSVAETIDIRLYKSLSLTAKFLEQTPKTSVTLKFADMFGKVLKVETVEVDTNGRELHEEMAFALDEKFKEPLIIENGKYKDIYFFEYAEKELIKSLLPEGENTIKLVFGYDGSYVLYETFDDVTDTWGFDKEAMAGDGVMHLLTGVGTANRTSSVKSVDDEIKNMKNLTVRFDWKNDVDTAKGRNSSFDLTDDSGNCIFSIRAKGKDGISYSTGGAGDTVMSDNYQGVNDWYTIVLTMDFENGILLGSITNKNTGRVYTINPVQIVAKNLSVISATYGYSSAGQQIDNFGFRDDTRKSNRIEIVKKEGTEVTVKVESEKGGNFYVVAAIFDGDRLLRVVTKNVILTESSQTEFTVDTIEEGQVKISAFEI